MCFKFETPDIAALKNQGIVFVIAGEAIANQLDLFRAYGLGLGAPRAYFGENWNAFSDCLLDLQWIAERDIFVVHHELPALGSVDLQTYVEILRDCISTWSSKETNRLPSLFPEFVPHSLTAFFPKQSEPLLSKIAANCRAS